MASMFEAAIDKPPLIPWSYLPRERTRYRGIYIPTAGVISARAGQPCIEIRCVLLPSCRMPGDNPPSPARMLGRDLWLHEAPARPGRAIWLMRGRRLFDGAIKEPTEGTAEYGING